MPSSGALGARKETALNHMEWMVYGFVVSAFMVGRMWRNGFLLLQLLPTKVDGKHYLETNSITALEQVTRNITKC